MDSSFLLSCALDIGEQMLISGAEIYRVEDCIKRICSSYGVKRIDVFTITSSIVATLEDNEHRNITQTRRISSYKTDLTKLDKLNQLSREMCTKKPDLEVVHEKIKVIKSSKRYPLWFECITYGAIAGAFTVFFGGSFADAGVSAIIGVVLRLIVYLNGISKVNQVFSSLLSSFAMCFLAFICVNNGFGESIDNIVIGNIMLLIPGVGLTNSLRDLISGDIMAGVLRLCEVILIALSIAAGYILSALVIGGVGI